MERGNSFSNINGEESHTDDYGDYEYIDFSDMEYYIDDKGNKVYYYDYETDGGKNWFGDYDDGEGWYDVFDDDDGDVDFSNMEYYIDDRGYKVYYYKEDSYGNSHFWNDKDSIIWTDNSFPVPNESEITSWTWPDDHSDSFMENIDSSWTNDAWNYSYETNVTWNFSYETNVTWNYYYETNVTWNYSDWHMSNESYIIYYFNHSLSAGGNDFLRNASTYSLFTPQYVILPLLSLLALLSLVTNIINTIVYKRMGSLKDNFLFLCLSAVDILHMLLVFCFAFDLALFQYKRTMKPNVKNLPEYLMLCVLVFQNWTCAVTVYLTTQRCLCIVFPFKVKSLFSLKRNVTYVVSIFILTLITSLFSMESIAYHRPGMWNPRFTTKTFFNLTSVQEGVAKAVDYFVYCIYPLLAIGINFFMTCFLIARLYSASKARKSLISDPARHSSERGQNQGGVMSKKDIKIVRLVLSISIVFFLTYTPTIVLRLMFLIQPNLVYNDIYLVIDLYRDTIDLTAKVANSGTNILFYYVLSSRYREEMKSMCQRS